MSLGLPFSGEPDPAAAEATAMRARAEFDGWAAVYTYTVGGNEVFGDPDDVMDTPTVSARDGLPQGWTLVTGLGLGLHLVSMEYGWALIRSDATNVNGRHQHATMLTLVKMTLAGIAEQVYSWRDASSVEVLHPAMTGALVPYYADDDENEAAELVLVALGAKPYIPAGAYALPVVSA